MKKNKIMISTLVITSLLGSTFAVDNTKNIEVNTSYSDHIQQIKTNKETWREFRKQIKKLRDEIKNSKSAEEKRLLKEKLFNLFNNFKENHPRILANYTHKLFHNTERNEVIPNIKNEKKLLRKNFKNISKETLSKLKLERKKFIKSLPKETRKKVREIFKKYRKEILDLRKILKGKNKEERKKIFEKIKELKIKEMENIKNILPEEKKEIMNNIINKGLEYLS